MHILYKQMRAISSGTKGMDFINIQFWKKEKYETRQVSDRMK